jgi:hypothetical protein
MAAGRALAPVSAPRHDLTPLRGLAGGPGLTMRTRALFSCPPGRTVWRPMLLLVA